MQPNGKDERALQKRSWLVLRCGAMSGDFDAGDGAGYVQHGVNDADLRPVDRQSGQIVANGVMSLSDGLSSSDHIGPVDTVTLAIDIPRLEC